MYSTTPIEIHEFSTGIHVQGTAENWKSTGFTGKYMNCTIDPIPNVLEISIKNKEFKVAEGASSNQPAIIGRVVGSAESAWSVIAIATPGRDDKGRYALFYRYFLCKGDDGLPKILAWIKAYQKQENRYPVFNPFKKRIVGNPNLSNIPITQFQDLDEQTKSWLSKETTPVIIQSGKLNFQPGQHPTERLNQLATEKAKTNNQPISWAFNVLTLEKIGRFQIIQAANPQAYQNLQQIKSTSPKALPPVVVNSPKALRPVVVNEQTLKSAIKTLMITSKAKNQDVEAIANCLAGKNFTEDYWRQIFDALGATIVITHNVYSSQFVNLLTLRAIVIPDTLPEYLRWLDNGKKSHYTYIIADNFQSDIGQIFVQEPQLEKSFQEKFTQGLQFLLFSLIDKKILAKCIDKFLTRNNSLWKKYSHKFIGNLDHDLKLLSKNYQNKKWRALPFKLTHKLLEKLKIDLQFCLYNNNKTLDKKYQDIGLFFEVLNAREIALLFYRLGYGKVPKKIFELFRIYQHQVIRYGITVQRDTTVLESSILLLEKVMTWKLELSGVLFLIILLITFISGVGATSLFSSFNYGTQDQAEDTTNNISSNSTQKSLDMNAALSKFDTTSKAIKKLVQVQNNLDDKKLEKLKKILNDDKKLQYDAIRGKLKKDKYKKEWVKAIYNYQKNEKLPADGIISDNGQTYQHIIALVNFDKISEIIKSLINNLNKSFNKKLKEEQIIKELTNALKNPNLNYEKGINKKEQEHQKEWIEAIKKYESDNFGTEADGIIHNSNDDTYTKLKTDISKRLVKSYNKNLICRLSFGKINCLKEPSNQNPIPNQNQ